MNKIIYTLIITCFSTIVSFGQIYCPDDVVASCFSDLSIEEFGNATIVSANYNQSQVKFVDENNTNACNEGTVLRKFYIDINYSNEFNEGEPFCIQTITLLYDALPINLQFPGELELTCVDNIPTSSPTWSWNPCDLIGYTYEDEVFDFEDGACQKIVRRFTVINWCEFDNDGGAGLYEGVQIIKIVDNEAPEIADCDDKVFDAVENCQATVVLTNSANDMGDCPSGMLTWTVSVDLWGDGTEDLVFGPNEPTPFRISPVGNGEEISIELPEEVGISNHKVVWNVTDGCGNFRSCNSEFEVVDNRPPTPYCFGFLSATLDGWDDNGLVIPASLFVKEAIDNCSSSDEILISFSENVNDVDRVIQCGEIGFQFFRIYFTDAAGNQDFCEAFMFVLDNESCAGKFAPQGRIMTPSGESISGVSTYLMEGSDMISEGMSNENGLFNFGEQSMIDSYYTSADKTDDPMLDVDLTDYKLMLDGLLGKTQLSYHQRIAGDINQDHVFDVNDLRLFKDVLLGTEVIAEEDVWNFIPTNQETNNDDISYESHFSIMDYQEGFSFYGIKTGDLTGASASFDGASSDDELNLSIEINDNEVVIYNQEEIVTGYFKINLKHNIKNNDESQFEYLSQDDESVLYNLSDDNQHIAKNGLNLTLDIDVKSIGNEMIIKDFISEATFLQNQSIDSYNVNWTIVDNRTQEVTNNEPTQRYSAYPSPFIDQITVEGLGIQRISMYDVSGRSVSVTTNINRNGASININENVNSGLYFIDILTSNGSERIRIVK